MRRKTGEGRRSEATEMAEAAAALKLSGEMPCPVDSRARAWRSGVWFQWFLECPMSW